MPIRLSPPFERPEPANVLSEAEDTEQALLCGSAGLLPCSAPTERLKHSTHCCPRRE